MTRERRSPGTESRATSKTPTTTSDTTNYTAADAQRQHITVDGPGRCTECSFHVETQGHREGCSTLAAVAPGEADFGARPTVSFIAAVERFKEAQRPESERGEAVAL